MCYGNTLHEESLARSPSDVRLGQKSIPEQSELGDGCRAGWLHGRWRCPFTHRADGLELVIGRPPTDVDHVACVDRVECVDHVEFVTSQFTGRLCLDPSKRGPTLVSKGERERLRAAARQPAQERL